MQTNMQSYVYFFMQSFSAYFLLAFFTFFFPVPLGFFFPDAPLGIFTTLRGLCSNFFACSTVCVSMVVLTWTSSF